MNNRAKKARHARRWGRYFNHYAHITDVGIGGSSAVRVILDGFGRHRYAHSFVHVRRQGR